MLRTFEEHHVRINGTLDGRWDFLPESERKSGKGLPKTYSRAIQTPSVWEMIPGLENYRGDAWFRTEFSSGGGMAARIVFGGVSHTADVYVDGKKRGHHYDAFTPFDVVVPNLSEGMHELVVKVNNGFGDHSALHRENDYYTYGGITRPVEVQLVPEVYVDKLYVLPVKKGKSWNLEVRMILNNWSKKAVKRTAIVTAAGSEIELGTVTVPAGGRKEIKGILTSLDVCPWTSEEPSLYFVLGLLLDEHGEVVDDLMDRVGFREVKVKGKKLLLNGKSIRLRGYNRHEDHPQFGCAVPVTAMVHDLEIMRDLGCNIVRTCHYPNDRRFLDLCDEMGFYVWEESHARAVDFRHPKFHDQILESTREMIDWHYNHPSIIIWASLNECESETKFGYKEHKAVIGLIKKMDPSRPVTFASNRSDKDTCLGLVDIVSWNFYTGWYWAGFDEIKPYLNKMIKWLDSPKSKGGSGKPVFLSEFGGGAIYGNRQTCRSKWSEEYQADVLDATLEVYLNHPRVVGATIWQFCDVRITQKWWSGRPRTMNNKGTVDEYRRPKLAYEVVKKKMLESKAKFEKKK